MDNSDRLDAMARWMWDARTRRLPYRNLPDDLRPRLIAEAYRAQEVYYRLAEPVYGAVAGAKIGARAGIVWDACNAGRPAFRKELAPLLAHQVASIGVIGRIDDPDSTSIATKILEELLSPGKPPVTAETVLAAGRAARAVTRLNLTSTLLGGREPS